MRFSNKFGLPETLIRAAQKQEASYDRGNVDRSVTQLVQSSRIDALRRAHFTEMTKDISEEFWALFGNAVHTILELGAGPNDHVEERLYLEIDGWRVSGKADLQEYDMKAKTVVISDYKVTPAMGIMQKQGPVKPEWERQLNLLAYLLHKNRPEFTVKQLWIVAIVRDWQRTQAAIDPLYPQSPVINLKVPLWSIKRQESYLRERVGSHRTAEMLHAVDAPLPECTDEERWMRDSSWAVMKTGSKKASRVFDSEAGAMENLATRKAGYEVVYRPGKSVRCEGNYCQVAEWCDQWARIKAEQQPSEDESETETERTA
jgi:hypothetical protein